MTVTNNFVPCRQIISNITQSDPAVVTTTQPHGYLEGLFIRIDIPYPGSMYQLNNKQFLIKVLSSNMFSIDVDATAFDTFTLSTDQSAQVIPTGEFTTLVNAVRNNFNIIPET